MLKATTAHCRFLSRCNRSTLSFTWYSISSSTSSLLTQITSSSRSVSHLFPYTVDSPKSVFKALISNMSTSDGPQLSAIESAKRAAARLAVKEHFNPEARYIGIGSGSTIVYAVEAIQELKDPRIQNILFVPTGYQSRQVRWNSLRSTLTVGNLTGKN